MPEADTAYGISDKSFALTISVFMRPMSGELEEKLTLTMGLRWDWFGWPTEKNGRFAGTILHYCERMIKAGLFATHQCKLVLTAVDASLPSIRFAFNEHTLTSRI